MIRRLFPMLAAGLLTANAALATEEYRIAIKNHRFQPEELAVPAGVKFRLRVDNRDATPEEFESYDLNREKVIAGNSSAILFIGPLKPGTYRFFGEFNMKTARGRLIAR